MEMDDTVMCYFVHLTLGCFVASNRMQMRIYELQFFAFSALAVDKCWWCRLYSHAKMDAKIRDGEGRQISFAIYQIFNSSKFEPSYTNFAKSQKNILPKSRLYILFDHINMARRVEYPKKSSFQIFCAKVESFTFCNVQENGPRPFGV